MEIIKLSIVYIAEPLSCLVNKSFTSGFVPDSLNIARVVEFALFSKMATMLNLLIIGQFLCYLVSLKYLKNLFITAF